MANESGQNVDARLLGLGQGVGSAMDEEEQSNVKRNDEYSAPVSRSRWAGIHQQAQSQALKMASKEAAKKAVTEEATALFTSTFWRVALYYLGIPALIIGGILMIFIFISISKQSPLSSSSNNPNTQVPVK